MLKEKAGLKTASEQEGKIEAPKMGVRKFIGMSLLAFLGWRVFTSKNAKRELPKHSVPRAFNQSGEREFRA